MDRPKISTQVIRVTLNLEVEITSLPKEEINDITSRREESNKYHISVIKDKKYKIN